MPVGTETVTTYYAAQAATARAVTRALTNLWGTIGSDFDAGWLGIRDAAVAAVTAGQVRAAALPPLFLDQVLAADGLEPTADAHLSPAAFAGITASGQPLEESLYSSVIYAKQAVTGGLTPDLALGRGRVRLTMLGATEVQDAGRGSMQAAMLLEPHIAGYVRRVQLPACGRCIIQAGKFFTKNTGFLRHPRCDCVHVPVTSRAERFREDSPEELFAAMTPAEQDKALGAGPAQQVREGANLGKVVNRSGMQAAGSAQARRRRLTPQALADDAGDPGEYRRLLTANGYL